MIIDTRVSQMREKMAEVQDVATLTGQIKEENEMPSLPNITTFSALKNEQSLNRVFPFFK